MAKLLLIEDDQEMAKQLCKWLERELYVVEHSLDGDDGLYKLTNYHYDIAIVDWNLPAMEGVEICRRIWAKKKSLPLLMLTSRGDIKDKLKGLDYGAMDYLVKPVPLPELSARIRSLLRRRSSVEGSEITIADIRLDTAARTLTIHDSLVKLPPRQFELLVLLAKHNGKPVSRNTILKTIWDDSDADAGSNFRVQLMKLRQMLSEAGSTVQITFDQTHGYTLVASPEPGTVTAEE